MIIIVILCKSLLWFEGIGINEPVMNWHSVHRIFRPPTGDRTDGQRSAGDVGMGTRTTGGNVGCNH